MVDWYPSPRIGWHVGLELGASLTLTVIDRRSLDSIGPSAAAFAGYDWWLGAQVSMGLVFSLAGGTIQTARDSNNDDSGYRFAPVEASAAVTWLLH
jgi:hypothetical protein